MYILNIFLCIKKLLFVYQQELYFSQKLLRFAYSPRVFQDPEKRQKLDFTLKAKILYATTLFLFFFFLGVSVFYFGIFGLIAYFFLLELTPFFLILSHTLFSPFECQIKKRMIKKASLYLDTQRNHLHIIALAGSYGKTSAKDVVSAVLSQKYSVFSSPGNKNTPLGFSEYASKISLTDEFLVLEFGEMWKGDIAELCEIIRPDTGIITGINVQHLEQFGSEENIISTINELSSFLKKENVLFANASNALVKESVPKSTQADIVWYGNEEISYTRDEKQGNIIVFYKDFRIVSQFYASYFTQLVSLGLKVGEHFKVPEKQIFQALESLHPSPHRMTGSYNEASDILILDDTYNGNIDGALEASKTLGEFPSKYKIYITPGLVELGKFSQSLHNTLGQSLAKNADEIWLITNSVTPFIKEGIGNAKKIREFPSMNDVFIALKTDIPMSSVVLMQNDWTDNYQ
jgi:UDP-N-acetylmuramoyl-tripeptide--D-alanyl-D-alanine ligase